MGNTQKIASFSVPNNLSIAKGDIDTMSHINKFGQAPDFDTGDNAVSIWDGANDAGINQMTYTYSTTSAINSISSSDNGDTQDIEIQGLDAYWNVITQTVTLTGQTRKALTTSLIRVYRLKNCSSTDLAGNVYCYENTAISTGISFAYNFAGETANTVNTCIIWGYSKDPDNTIDNTSVSARLNTPTAQYKDNITVISETITDTPDTDTGYWEIELIETVNMETTNVKYIFNVGGREYEKSIPNENTKNFWELT